MLISTASEQSCSRIQSEEIAESMEAIFDLSFEAAKTYRKTTALPVDEAKKIRVMKFSSSCTARRISEDACANACTEKVLSGQ